jgi:hypothetical protein
MPPARKKTEPPPPPEGWTIDTEISINGRNVSPGTELSIRGVRGRVRFMRRVTTPTACWIDVVTPDPHKILRSFTVDRVKTVHRLDKTRENLT